jgi:hypothetical protein
MPQDLEKITSLLRSFDFHRDSIGGLVTGNLGAGAQITTSHEGRNGHSAMMTAENLSSCIHASQERIFSGFFDGGY